MKLEELNTSTTPTWCPGCGNYGILSAMKNAIVKLGIKSKDLVITSGIGCSGKVPYWIRCYGFNGLHGRPLPLAVAIKLVNPELTVIAHGGDGDGYSEGTNHFIHTMRRNIDITYVVHNNQIYGLTTGQTSPTSDKDNRFITKSTPYGNPERAFNPLTVAIASGATFVARGFAGDVLHLTELFVQAIKHKGAALVDVLQPCISFNKKNTFAWFRERVYKLEDEKHDFSDKMKAYMKASEWGNKIPIGLFYKEDYEVEVGQKVIDEDLSRIDISSIMGMMK
ncbi:2-oxoacid ferredoxin oxidoreductase [Candidatus Woesearchaeota archaeon]|nr:MAG: 2-oxoacid ferredoxin oxidoreductase [Candidatus Woesearchaeota archaeon]